MNNFGTNGFDLRFENPQNWRLNRNGAPISQKVHKEGVLFIIRVSARATQYRERRKNNSKATCLGGGSYSQFTLPRIGLMVTVCAPWIFITFEHTFGEVHLHARALTFHETTKIDIREQLNEITELRGHRRFTIV